MNEKLGLSLMFAVLVDASASRRGVKVMAAVSRQLDGLRKDSGSNRAFQEAA